uniref:Uncharacterized protein n=1 Tax=Anopheles coluzzii TaxID=1518534 RepID=A0A8W7PIC4_ANOCL
MCWSSATVSLNVMAQISHFRKALRESTASEAESVPSPAGSPPSGLATSDGGAPGGDSPSSLSSVSSWDAPAVRTPPPPTFEEEEQDSSLPLLSPAPDSAPSPASPVWCIESECFRMCASRFSSHLNSLLQMRQLRTLCACSSSACVASCTRFSSSVRNIFGHLEQTCSGGGAATGGNKLRVVVVVPTSPPAIELDSSPSSSSIFTKLAASIIGSSGCMSCMSWCMLRACSSSKS